MKVAVGTGHDVERTKDAASLFVSRRHCNVQNAVGIDFPRARPARCRLEDLHFQERTIGLQMRKITAALVPDLYYPRPAQFFACEGTLSRQPLSISKILWTGHFVPRFAPRQRALNLSN